MVGWTLAILSSSEPNGTSVRGVLLIIQKILTDLVKAKIPIIESLTIRKVSRARLGHL